jgi:hypothetical protein
MWAFVDYENVGTLETINIAEYERIFVFCGPNNNKIKVGKLSPDAFCSMELIGLNSTGSNNLDFHLAFYLGRYHEIAEKGIVFHIISNDAGFNGLVNHLKKIGRECKKIEIKKKTKAKPQKEPSLSLSDEALQVVSKLKEEQINTPPPKTKAKLINWIKSQCHGIINDKLPDTIFKELLDSKRITVSGNNITYNFDH